MLFVLVVAGSGKVWAGGFNLKSIGNVSTEGLQISHWWYTGLQPTFRGEATPGGDVTITIDGTAMVASADSAGEWVYTPAATLGGGDHVVSLASGGSTVNFTLTLGSDKVDWNAVESSSGGAMPAAGTAWPTLVLIATAGTMMAGAGMLRLKS